jgi:ADP-ribose pyrophosphatase
MKIIDVEILRSQVFGDGGFARLRRFEVRNVREDGSRSAAYHLDAVERPAGADAVVVLAYEGERDARVLLRRGLRPVARWGRSGQPTREGTVPPLFMLEAVAGVLEPGDVGDAGLRRRAAAELREETGLAVSPEEVKPLGPPVFISLGLMAERLYFCRVEVPLRLTAKAAGDGTLLEEGGAAEVYALGEALELCRTGRIEDAKTEVALRRLAEHLGFPPSAQVG